jgi:hypothetical protein
MASILARLRFLVMFEVYSYRYYRKHFQKSSWSPMLIVAALGLCFHFLVLVSGQVYAELVGLARLLQPKRPQGL